MAPLLYKVAIERVQLHLYQYSLSFEIARFVHFNGVDEMTRTLLKLNLDRD